MGKLESAENARLVLRLLLFGLEESAAEAHSGNSGRHLVGDWRAICRTIDVVGLLVFLDDAWLLSQLF